LEVDHAGGVANVRKSNFQYLKGPIGSGALPLQQGEEAQAFNTSRVRLEVHRQHELGPRVIPLSIPQGSDWKIKRRLPVHHRLCFQYLKGPIGSRLRRMTSTRSVSFNTSRVRLEGDRRHKRSSQGSRFQYLKGPIGSREQAQKIRQAFTFNTSRVRLEGHVG